MPQSQRIDFIGFPVEFGCVLPDWLHGDDEDHSQVVLGGGSGVKHGHPYVMCNYQFKSIPGMRDFQKDDHVEPRMLQFSNEKKQGRLITSCERHCVGSTFLETAGCGSGTMSIASPGWNTIRQLSRKTYAPFFIVNKTSFHLYLVSNRGTFELLTSVNAFPQCSESNAREHILHLRMDVRPNGMMIVAALTGMGLFTAYSIDFNEALEAFSRGETPAVRELLPCQSLHLEAEPTDLCLMLHPENDFSILVPFGKNKIAIYRRDGTNELIPFGMDTVDKVSASKLQDPSQGVSVKFISRIYPSGNVEEQMPTVFIAGYWVNPQSTVKRPPRRHFIAIMNLMKNKLVYNFGGLLDHEVRNISDIHVMASREANKSGDIFFCYSTDADTKIYRLQLDHKNNVMSRNTMTAGWAAVTDSTFPPIKILYLDRLDACLVVWSNYTTALVDLKDTNLGDGWKGTLLIVIMLAAMVYVVVTNAQPGELEHWFRQLQLYFEYSKSIIKSTFSK